MTADAFVRPEAVRPLPLDPLLVSPILPTLTRLAVPNMIAMLAISMVAVAETAYVGLLGVPALAAMAMVFPMAMMQQMLSAGAMGGGVSSAISRAIGAGDDVRAQALALHAVIIGASAALAFSIIFLGFGRQIYSALGARGPVLEEALVYSNTIFTGVAGIWLTNTLASVLRGSGNMKVPAIILLSVAVLQILISGGFGLGIAGLPRLGMLGVGLGQVIAFAAGTLVLLAFLRSRHSRVRLVFSSALLRGEMFWDILKVGAVACLSPLQSVLTVLILTGLIARFGTNALAGYGIGVRLEFLLIPITFAIGIACVPLVGMAIGAGDVERARRVAWTGGAMSALIMGAIGLVFAAIPQLWANIFTSDPGVLASAYSYLGWAAPAYGFFGLGLCLYFASQGSGKVLGPVLAGTARLLVVAAVGWWLASQGAAEWSIFALIGLAMIVFGVLTAAAVYFVPWGKSGLAASPRSA
jgi:putative MATE family efflux protein